MVEKLQIWNKQVVVDSLKDSPIPNTVEFGEDRGGDWDLNPVYVRVASTDDCLRIIPFVDPSKRGGAPAENDNVPVYAVELRNLHGDSRGGMLITMIPTTRKTISRGWRASRQQWKH